MFGRATLYSPSTHPHETVVLLLNMLHKYGTALRKPNIRGLVLNHRQSVAIFIFQTTVCARRTRTLQVIAGVCLEFWACRVLHRVVFPSIRLVRFGIFVVCSECGAYSARVFPYSAVCAKFSFCYKSEIRHQWIVCVSRFCNGLSFLWL